MVVERGYREYEDAGMYGWVLGEFAKEVEVLRNAVNVVDNRLGK